MYSKSLNFKAIVKRTILKFLAMAFTSYSFMFAAKIKK